MLADDQHVADLDEKNAGGEGQIEAGPIGEARKGYGRFSSGWGAENLAQAQEESPEKGEQHRTSDDQKKGRIAAGETAECIDLYMRGEEQSVEVQVDRVGKQAIPNSGTAAGAASR